jgi:uncharacterized Zn finger protein
MAYEFSCGSCRAGLAVEFRCSNGCSDAAELTEARRQRDVPIAMRIPCPSCGELHIDDGEFATKAHHTHACQACGMVWRPAVVATVGVRFLPGYKNGGDS